MTAKDRQLISILLDKFVKTFEGQPGVLDINSDEWLGNNVVVLVDRDCLKGELPDNYNGLAIHTIDVRKFLKNGKRFMDKVKDSNIDLSDENNYTTCWNLTKAIELCAKLIQPKEKAT
jgi:hypothetical protein